MSSRRVITAAVCRIRVAGLTLLSQWHMRTFSNCRVRSQDRRISVNTWRFFYILYSYNMYCTIIPSTDISIFAAFIFKLYCSTTITDFKCCAKISIECRSCLQCFDSVGWVSDQEEHMDHEKFECWCADMVISLERGANDLRMVQVMPLPSRRLLLH